MVVGGQEISLYYASWSNLLGEVFSKELSSAQTLYTVRFSFFCMFVFFFNLCQSSGNDKQLT